MKKKMYIAYGSNMNLGQMAYRCPTAVVEGVSQISGYSLLFKGQNQGAFATIEPNSESSVPVLIWSIDPSDEQALDRYEGYPSFYTKENIELEFEGETITAMVYVMNDGFEMGYPSNYYINSIREGYESAGIDTDILDRFISKSNKLALQTLGIENEETTGFSFLEQ